MKTKRLEIPMYNTSVILIAGTSEDLCNYFRSGVFLRPYPSVMEVEEKERKDFLKSLEKKTTPTSSANAFCTRIVGTTRDFVIVANLSKRIYQEDYKKAICTAIPHEVRHYVDYIMERCGIKDTEAAAYMTGWLTGEFLPFLL